MNYVSLCKRLAVCTALGIALSLPVGAVWNTMQPQLAYAEEYSSCVEILLKMRIF